MNSILIAVNNSDEVYSLKKVIAKEFKVSFINSPSSLDDDLDTTDLVLLDHNFTENSGIDFLMTIMKKTYLPVLILTPIDDPQCAIDAMRVGAYNYIVKTENYLQILNHSIREAIENFNEKEILKQTIVELKERINELESQLGISDIKGTAKSSSRKINIVAEIVSRLKRGEINLPTIPQIGRRFKIMIDKGATLREVSNLLKQDVAISSKLISLSNSASYRGVTENKTVEHAVGRLGLATTKQYVEVITNRAVYVTKNNKYLELINIFWKHSLSCAYASQACAEMLKLKFSDEIFTIGLFHDIGKSMLLQIISELEKDDKFEGLIDRASVIKTLDEHHCKFGALLLKKWRFPQAYVNIVLFHDQLEDADPITRELMVVNFANILVKTIGYTDKQNEEIDLENAYSTKLLKLNSKMISDIKVLVQKRMKDMSGIVV